MDSPYSIETESVGRIYKLREGKAGQKERVALRDITLQVRQGELFGLLGPNGAGKTTLIKILTTLLAPSTGWARVAGFDVSKDPGRVRPLINMVSGGEPSGYGLLSVKENLRMFAQLYGIPLKETNVRIDALLKAIGLEDRARTKSSDLSTGLRQKMNIVRGFLTDPDVLFLDEPTLGLDVNASRDVRNFVRSWMAEDRTRTLLLTTHYMAEAEDLCDRVAIINDGRVLACDTPANLKRTLRADSVFHLEISPINGGGMVQFEEVPGVRSALHRPGDGHDTLELVLEREDALEGVLRTMTANNLYLMNLQKRDATLEDVFVSLVGKSLADA